MRIIYVQENQTYSDPKLKPKLLCGECLPALNLLCGREDRLLHTLVIFVRIHVCLCKVECEPSFGRDECCEYKRVSTV